MNFDAAYKRINRIPIRYIPIMILVSLCINLLSLALPLSMKQIYGRLILNQATETLMILLIGCMTALFLEALLRKIKESSNKWIASKYEYQLTNYLLQKLLNIYEPQNLADSYNANVEKFGAISRVTAFYATGFYQLFIDLPFMCLFLYLIYFLGGKLVWVPIILSILYVAIMLINGMRFQRHRSAQMDANDQLMTELTETLEKIHLIKAAGLESYQISKYRKALDRATTASFNSNQYLMYPETIGPYFSQITLFAILLGGAFLMAGGGISFGEITACALLGGRAIAPVQSITNLYLQRKDIKLQKSRLDQIAAIPDQYASDIPMFPEDIAGTIELIGLQFENEVSGVQEQVNSQISAGSFVHVDPQAFLGYRQVFRMIVGKEKIQNGKILIDNLDITEWNMNGLKGKIEYLSDHACLFKGSVLDNITFFNASKNFDAYEAAALTGLDAMVSQMSEGFETQLDGQSVNYLSSAFIQRLNLTRALLVRPRILIIDRVDESMDMETLSVFLWLLGKFKGHMTILIASNHPEICRLADRKLLN